MSRIPSKSQISGAQLLPLRSFTGSNHEFSFWYIKLYALTSIRDFEGLDAFAKSKRSPIGYETFVRHLIEKGHLKEAATFVPRCDSNKRVDLYVDCGDWRAAGKECKERGDKAKMEYDFSTPASSKPANQIYLQGNSGRTAPTP